MIERYLDEAGRIIQWPKKHILKLEVIKYLGEKYEVNKIYTEKEVNEIIFKWHTFSDHTLLRRELIMKGLLDREADGSAYWKVKDELF